MFKSLILIFLVFFISCTTPKVQENTNSVSPTPKRELKKDIPNASWVKIFFEGFESKVHNLQDKDFNKDGKIIKHGGLNETAEKNGFSILRETLLPENDLEVRIWVGFGLYGNDGLILRRNSGNWSAVNLRGMLCDYENKGKYNLEAPKSGWEVTWGKLIDAGILTLPDSSEIDYKNGITDGKSFVVETNFNDIYRTYEYGNPKYEEVKEAKQIMKIGQIIVDEFDLESFSAETGGCKINE